MTATKVDLTSGEQVQGTLPIANGGTGATSLAAAGIATNTVSTWSGTTVTITTASGSWVFTGSAATTATLPAVSGNNGFRLFIENRGSAAITLQRAGTDQIWFLSALTAVTIAAGASMLLVCDGTYWNTLSTDLANNSVGVLPVANGGTGQNSLTSLTLTTPTIKGYTETEFSIGTVGASYTISLTNGTMQHCTLTSATACTFTMPTAAAGLSFVLAVRQPASGTATTATFTGVKWPAAGAPTITATLGKADVLTFFCYDGTNWYGSYSQGYTY
jgi:hypothetical protein